MGGMDTLTQLGVAGGVLLIMGLFLLGVLRLVGRMGKPIVEAHVKTMEAFRNGQVKNTTILAKMEMQQSQVTTAILAEIQASRRQNGEEHRAIMAELSRVKGLPLKRP